MMATDSGRPRAPSCATAPLVGALIGWAAAVLEILYLVRRPGSAVGRQDLLECALFYAIVGAGLGLLLSALARIARRRPPSASLAAVSIAGLFAFLLIGGYVNLYRLPGAASRATLVATGLMFLAAVLLSTLLGFLLRRLARRIEDVPGIRGVDGSNRGARLRRAGWAALGILLLVTGAISLAPGQKRSRPERRADGKELNVLLLTADALRPDHLSLHGYARPTSPNLDAWSHEALVFDHAFAQSSWTKPSTATILTGLYPSVHRVNLTASGLPPSTESVFESFSRAGYATGLFTANSFVTPLFGFGRGVERLYAPSPPRLTQFMLGHLLERAMEWSALARAVTGRLVDIERAIRGEGVPPGGLQGDGLQQAFFEWLDRDAGAIGVRAADATPGKAERRPFFAYIHYMEPHAPYDPPSPEDERFLPERLKGRPKVKEFPPYRGFLPFEKGRAISADSLAGMIALYDGAILHLDGLLGTLIRELKRRDLYDRTLILLTADHGEEFYEEHGGWGHGHSLFEELLRVPLIVSCPALFATPDDAGGRRIAQFARHVDLVPTVLDLCRVPSAEERSGTSLGPLLLTSLRQASETRDEVVPLFSEVDHGGHYAYALRVGTEKAILAHRGGEERLLLFDLARDPREQEDLASREPARAERWRAQLEAFRTNVRRGAREEVTVTMDEATRERLRGLGYIR